MFSLILFLVWNIVSVISGPAISLTLCKSDDNACVTQAVKVAYPLILQENSDIGTETMDPLYQTSIEGNLATIKYKLTNTNTLGFKKCEVQSAKFSGPDTLEINLLCHKFDLAGQYEMTGNLLGLPVEGKGDYSVDTKKFDVNIKCNLNTIKKDGKEYKHVKDFTIDANPLERVIFDFKNLFNGQKDLAEPFLKFVNENWKDVAKELQQPVFIANVKKIIKNANKYLKTISIDEYSSK